MALTPADIRHVAELARLGLSETELERLREQLTSILEHIAVLDRLDTSAISPTAQVNILTNVMRDDTVGESLPRDQVLKNAPSQTDGFFDVQAVLPGIIAEEPR